MKVSDIVTAALPALVGATVVWSPEPVGTREAKFSVLEQFLSHRTNEDPVDWKLAAELKRQFDGKWNNLIVTMDDFEGFDQSQFFGSHSEGVNDNSLDEILKSSSWNSLTLGLKSLTSKYALKFEAFDNRIHSIWNYARSSPKVMWTNNDYEWVETMPAVVDELAHLLRLNDVVEVAAYPNHVEAFVFHSQGLRLAAEKYGNDSSEFKQLEADIKSLLERLTSKFNVYLIAGSPKHTEEEISKRNEHLESVFARAEDTSCFTSEEACQTSTSNCSNHGVCTKAKDCWKCLCSPTSEKKKGTTTWAGFDCSKKDVSFQANLFLWTGIAATVVIAGGVSLLFSLGSEPLPGVLDAMTKKSS